MKTITKKPAFVAGQLLVKFKADVNNDVALKFLSDRNLEVLREYPGQSLFLVALPGELSVEQGISELSELPEIEFAEPNHIYRAED